MIVENPSADKVASGIGALVGENESR